MSRETEDDLFEQLSDLWLSDSPPSSDDSAWQVRRALARDRVQTWMEIAVGGIGTTYGIWIGLQGAWLIGAAAVVFSGISLLLMLDHRRRVLSSLTDPVVQQMGLRYRLERSRFRRGWIGIGVSLLAQCFLMIILVAEPRFMEAEQGVLVVFGAQFLIILGIMVSIRQIAVGAVARERAREYLS